MQHPWYYTANAMPPRRRALRNTSSYKLTSPLTLSCHSARLCRRMEGGALGPKGNIAYKDSNPPFTKLRASWSDEDVNILLDYVEQNLARASDHLSFPTGHFNNLLPLLPSQPNGYFKTARNCYDKWESVCSYLSLCVQHTNILYSWKVNFMPSNLLQKNLGLPIQWRGVPTSSHRKGSL